MSLSSSETTWMRGMEEVFFDDTDDCGGSEEEEGDNLDDCFWPLRPTKWEIMSTGTGKIMVVFFSFPILLKVCKRMEKAKRLMKAAFAMAAMGFCQWLHLKVS